LPCHTNLKKKTLWFMESSHDEVPNAAPLTNMGLGYPQRLPLNFSLYITFPPYFPPIFYLPQRFPLNTPPIPHYHYKISFSIPTINFLSTNNYSWTHNTVFRVINSDTLDLGGERRGPTRRGAVGGTAAAIGCPLQPTCKGRGSGSLDRCGQS
jgi:hypothetical protein